MIDSLFQPVDDPVNGDNRYHEAYQRLGETDVPKFTVIVAQKRHHTKLFQAKGHENVPAGTVVDTKIVHPTN
ncbi:hypothetical protein IGI04_037030 [Brassica rapa subsp. trilocularis]|nr:hypothetical protein IGI04_037030 [Brassica rapa subsp. trilocularis]